MQQAVSDQNINLFCTFLFYVVHQMLHTNSTHFRIHMHIVMRFVRYDVICLALCFSFSTDKKHSDNADTLTSVTFDYNV